MAALTLARAYQHSFDSHPNTTLAVTGGCLNALGDAVAQVSQNALKKEKHEDFRYDVARTMRFFCFGFAISPVMGRWNGVLERRFPLRPLRGTNKVSFPALYKRVACDQLVMAPAGLVFFIGSMGMMEGRSPRQIGDRFKDLYLTALLANWKVWPIAQLVNFRYMPLPYRVPFTQACGVFWTLYLSILNSKESKRQDDELTVKRLQTPIDA
ncbi:hypothetical protein GALMADRAFT_233120 [Galerina marginata CBS 339.88]|uniref:Uncharacterized protein n=1 Tax=Galerina marginata (strain CBS 339.88) TaxID=685588 RepID=A0A067TXQ4_GALM3|nr:hypothetical protein GALMADRAFT_233120 [Galerina marginata CBS 339.88]